MNEELAAARGQIGVLRDLLNCAMSIIEDSIEEEKIEGTEHLIMQLEKMQAAIEGTKP